MQLSMMQCLWDPVIDGAWLCGVLSPSIHMRYAGPVIVAENRRASDLVELIELAAAYLASLPFGDLNLGIVPDHYHDRNM
jgi:hypothetical protein